MTGVEHRDSLELLLGDVAPERLALARRLTTAMRLLLANTREGCSPSAVVRSDSARDEWEGHRRVRLGERLRDLVAHLARAHAPGNSFVRFPSPRASYTATWAALLRILDDSEQARLGLRVPLPSWLGPVSSSGPGGSSGPAGLRRILDAHGEHAMADPGGIEELHHLHWRARIEWVLDGSREPFLESLRRIAERARPLGDGEARSVLDGILADTLALHLDAAALSQAMEIVQALGWDRRPAWQRAVAGTGSSGSSGTSATALSLDPEHSGRGRAYAAIAMWLSGATDAIPDVAHLRGPFGGDAPERWTRLLDRLGPPSADPFPAPSDVPPSEAAFSPEPTRRAFGARALIVRVFDGARGLRVVESDLAPALREHLGTWERSRHFAASEPGTPEHVMVGAGRGAAAIAPQSETPLIFGIGSDPSAAKARDGGGLRGPLAVCCEPIFERRGELIGCLWLEFDHRLLPDPSHAHAAACSLAADLALGRSQGARGQLDRLAARPRAIAAEVDPIAHAQACLLRPSGEDSLRPLRSAWISVMDRVLIKTQERRWAAFHWGHVDPSASPSSDSPWPVACVAAGGDGQLGRWTGGAASILRRSMRAAATIRFDRSAPGCTFFEEAAQSACIPLMSGGHVIGALVLESSRRGDLGADDVERWSLALNQRAGELELALIHGLDTAFSDDGGLGIPTAAPDAGNWLGRVRALSRSEADVLILGELGSGRRTAARAMHHAGAALAEPGPLEVVESFGITASLLERRLEAAIEGSLVLSGIEALDPRSQAALALWMTAPRRGRARLLATASSACEGEAAFGAELRLEHRQLATTLMRASLRTEPLRKRRHWIPSIAEAMLAKVAHREGGCRPALDDEAVALLWRQPWRANGVELDALLYSAFLGPREHGEARLTAIDLTKAFHGLGASITGRLASRDPSVGDLASAAWTTRTASGRINKTRAALYLGWDPATVATRVREAGLGELDAVTEALR